MTTAVAVREGALAWDPAEVLRWGRSLAGGTPAEVLARAAERFPRLVLTTGFGPEGCVLVHVIARHRLPIEVITLDTGLLFPETHALWRQLEERYGLAIRAVRPQRTLEEQAAALGDRLWEREPDLCCRLRKVEPLAAVLAGYDAWVTGIRHDQTRERVGAALAEWDGRFGLAKVNPLVEWTDHDVWSYLRMHDVPFNALHERGYPSIGCHPCTTAVSPGEPPRAGRWRGRGKTECGLHEVRLERLDRKGESRDGQAG